MKFKVILIIMIALISVTSVYGKNGIVIDSQLGKELFESQDISRNNKVSCSSCHNKKNYLTSSMKMRKNAYGIISETDVPILYDINNKLVFGLHGEFYNIESKIDNAMRIELGNFNSHIKFKDEKIERADVIKAIKMYLETFNCTKKLTQIFEAIKIQHDSSAGIGYKLFSGKAKCYQCHSISITPPILTDNATHGTKKILTPTLVNISNTAPYMHNMSVEKLDTVISMYANNDMEYTSIHINLTKEEQRNIFDFLSIINCKK